MIEIKILIKELFWSNHQKTRKEEGSNFLECYSHVNWYNFWHLRGM